MIGISITEIAERVEAEDALNYMTSNRRGVPLTPDSRDAMEIAVESSWAEVAGHLGEVMTNWQRSGDIIEIDMTEGVDERSLRGKIESALYHLTLAHCYELTYPEPARRHSLAAESMISAASGLGCGGIAVIPDGI